MQGRSNAGGYRLGPVLVLLVGMVAGLLVPSTSAWAATPICGGLPATIVGTHSSERLVGTPGADVIVGLGGFDVIEGLEGDDVICSGAGAGDLRGGPGRDLLIGSGGNEDIRG